MSPAEYIAGLQRFLEPHPHIASFQLNTDHRGESFLYLHGRLEFLHGDTLDFKEFLAFHSNEAEKYMYAYNYRQNEQVIFRYDNAPDPRAQHLPSYPAHKHAGETLLPSGQVSLMDVVAEVMNRNR